MADHNKKEKIAAAKKKLKQFQRNRSVSSTRESAEREVAPKVRGRDTARAGYTGEHSAQTTPHIDSSATDISTSNDVSADSIHDSPATPPHTHTEAQHHHLPSFSNGEDRLRGTLLSHVERPSATTESLHQLSRQVNGLLSESAAYLNGTESASQGMQDLEDRNRELASSLAQHQQVNEQLNVQNHQLREHSQALQTQLETERNSFHEKQKKDIGSLKEQLQVHIQTIGILVAEKTELQSQVSQSQRIGNQRIEEIEELSGRLKASRQRVSDLERSLSSSSQSSQQLEKGATESAKELDRLKLEAYKSNKQNEELKQQVSELSQQLQSKSKEWISSSEEVTELHKKLEMAELYAQQLSNENSTTVGSLEVLNSLQKERDSLVSRLHQQEELSLKLQIERDQVTEQYQQYTEQLRHQASQLTQQVTVLTEEREQLLNKQHDLEGGMHELQTKLEDAENTPQPPPAPSPSLAPTNSESPSIPPELVAELEKLRIDVVEAQAALEGRARDNVQLGRLLEEKEERIMNLERSVEEMGEANGDKVQLLESIQSDRTALSRALTQNKDLKSQLEELQEGFVKISTDNAELLTKLQTEQHSSYEWKVKLVQKEDEMNSLREMLSARETEVSTLQESHQSIEKEVHQHSQMRDRLQHYEAQAQLVYTLQNELTAAQDMMEALTTQNSELRTMLIKATEIKGPKGSGDSSEGGGNSGHDDVVASLQANIQQLENERTQLYESLKEQRKLSDILGIKIADLQEEVIRRTEDANPDSERISRTEYVELKTAMEMIQQKYMHVMHDKAELTDKADQLEHLVLQLQGETDTIGEYISLYHHQRALLQQREGQKNDYIAQLARDREQLQDKLGELQALVMQLLGERNMLHSYSQESSMPPSPLGGAALQEPSQTHSQIAQLANGINHYDNDWPDYTSSDSDSESETEPIVGGQLTPDSEVTPQSSPPGSPREPMPNRLEQLGAGDHHSLENGYDESLEKKHHHHNNHHHSNHHQHHHPHSHQQQQSESFPSAPAAPENDRTAHKILSLLTELGHSHMVEQVPLIDRNFLPCKYCKGKVQIV